MPGFQIWAVEMPEEVMDGLRAPLRSRGFTFVGHNGIDTEWDRQRTVILLPDGETVWARLAESVAQRTAAVVVLLDDLEPRRWGRVLSVGAGAAWAGSDPEALADVIVARARGELVIPVGCAVAILNPDEGALFNALEETLVELLAEGAPVRSIAEAIAFSERTTRRRLRSLYFKLGVSTYADAVEAAVRLRV